MRKIVKQLILKELEKGAEILVPLMQNLYSPLMRCNKRIANYESVARNQKTDKKMNQLHKLFRIRILVNEDILL